MSIWSKGGGIFTLLLFCFFQSIIAQDTSNYLIGTVHFEGLKKTKITHLHRFIDLQPGEKFHLHQLEKDAQQLTNLYGFTQVKYQLDTVQQDINITFLAEEAITFYPIINFGGIRDNLWYQLGFTDLNFLGRGMQLTTFYQNNDRRHNFTLYYRLPYIKGSRWGGAVNLVKFASVEPVFFEEGTVLYDYDNNSFGIHGIYELGPQYFIEWGGTYFVEKYRKHDVAQIGNSPGPDELTQPKVLAKFIHNFNRINYFSIYLFGFDNVTNLQTVYNIGFKEWFNVFLNETRYFKRIGNRGNIAARLRLGLSTNMMSPFAPFVLDSHVNIRGVGNRIDRGTGQLILNLEYRQTFLESNRFAGQVVAFSDLGTWRNPGGDLGDFIDPDNFRHFVGGGIRLIYKKAVNAIFRLDYGVDIYDSSQQGVVIGVGQYF